MKVVLKFESVHFHYKQPGSTDLLALPLHPKSEPRLRVLLDNHNKKGGDRVDEGSPVLL